MKKYYIYALSWDNKTKIGYTSNPKQRFGFLCSQAGMKRENATFSFYETTNPRLVEKNCHIMAENSHTRLAGEWFDCSHAQAISIIISNVTGDVCSEDHNPRLDKLISDLKTSITAGVSAVISSEFSFNETEFGDLSVIKMDGENWFILSEVAEIIGFESKPANIIAKITSVFNKAGINPRFHKKIKIATNHGARLAIVINEQGLFEMLTFSQKNEAILFRSWVIQNVLTGMIDYE